MLLNVFPHLIPGFETCSPSARANSNVPSPCTGLCVQPLGCRNRMNNGCGIGALFPAVSTWIAGLSSWAYRRTTSQFPESDRDRKPLLAPRALPYIAGFSLLADLDSVSRVTPRPPRPVTPAETSLTQSEPSPL